MVNFSLNLLIILLELIFFIIYSLVIISLIYSSIKGCFYVPTNKKLIKKILSLANLKKGQVFADLGCGDGRVVREAVKIYQVKGIGLEINPLLIYWSRFWAWRENLSSIIFKRADIFKTNSLKADAIYIFLFPNLIKKMTPLLKNYLKQNTLIISHGFKIDGFEKFLKKKLNGDPFPTYFYHI